jgi:multidrug efflux pump subunit AcrB
VNNSLILVEFSNEMREKGTPLVDSLAKAGRLRLVPILLTTVTTLAGLSPLMLEQSFQARFLIPMAILLVFGLMSSSVLTLLVLPAAMVVIDDIKRALYRLLTGRSFADAAPTAAAAADGFRS